MQERQPETMHVKADGKIYTQEAFKKIRKINRILSPGFILAGAGLETAFIFGTHFDTNIPALKETYYATISIIPSYIAIDGLVDTLKGTHHYLGLHIWKRLTRNPEWKIKLQKEIDFWDGKNLTPITNDI